MRLPGFAWQAALAAGLALTATAELLAPPPAPDILPAIQIAPAAQANADPAPDAASWANIILARPLFRPDRRPLAPDAATAAPLPRLSAIVITAAGATAIFSGDDGKSIAVPPGGMIAGYRVATITAGAVQILGPAGGQTLHPQFAPSGQAPDGAPGAVPGGGAPLPFVPAYRPLGN